jgi:hypothetical protein
MASTRLWRRALRCPGNQLRPVICDGRGLMSSSHHRCLVCLCCVQAAAQPFCSLQGGRRLRSGIPVSPCAGFFSFPSFAVPVALGRERGLSRPVSEWRLWLVLETPEVQRAATAAGRPQKGLWSTTKKGRSNRCAAGMIASTQRGEWPTRAQRQGCRFVTSRRVADFEWTPSQW